MKFVATLLPLAVSAAAILEERQARGAPVAGIDELKPWFQPSKAKRTLTKFGPYTIKGSTASKSGGGGLAALLGDSTLGGQAFFLSIRDGMCNHQAKGPCTVLGGKVGVSFTNGTVALPSNGIYIHHILSSDNTKKETPWISACNNARVKGPSVAAITGGTGYLGTGEDSSDTVTQWSNKEPGPIDGYHVGANDVFTAWAQLVNYNKEDVKVYVTFDQEWVPGIVGDNVKGVTISATSCSGIIKMSPTGPTNTTSGRFYIMEDGRLLLICI